VSLLAAEDVRIVYPSGLHALGPVSLSVAAGECVAILGPSGCGKSTLLSAFAGLLAPGGGAVRRGFKGAAGVVFQDPTLMPWATIAHNVALPLVLSGVSAADAGARAAAALEAVGLQGFEERKPRELSGGMRMRAALARALVSEPPALLLDEPFAAIDEMGRRDLDDLVLALKAERGLGVLFITHSVEEAVYLADRVIVLSPRPGRIIADLDVDGPALRNDAFFLSKGFIATCAQARRALAANKVAAP
jgi:NitT/TauT family transport system ATP-binding protein